MPITEDDIPNVFVSVLLVKGRSQTAAAGEPTATRATTARPNVPRTRRSRQAVVPPRLRRAEGRGRVEAARPSTVAADKEEYRPGEQGQGARRREGRDRARRAERSDAVGRRLRRALADRLSARPTCSARSTCSKALQVMNADNRQRIVSRRVLTPKGETEGGGGGADAGAGTLRKDFRVLAFWLGSVDDRRRRPRERRRQAAGVADDLPHHGGGRRSALAVRLGRRRGPHQQAGDAEADVPALPRASATRRTSARSSPVS